MNASDSPQHDYPNFHLVGVGLTCIYILTWYLQLGGRVGILGTIRFEFLLGTTLIILSLLHGNKLKYGDSNPFKVLVSLFFIICLIHVIFSVDIAFSWDRFFNRLVKFSMMALFLATFISSPKALRWALLALLVANLKIASEGIIGWKSGSLMWENQGIMRLHGPTGNYHHPNSFSGFALGTLPFVYFFIPVSNKYVRPAVIGLGVCALIIILYTGSRTGYVGLFGLIAYVFWITKNKKRAIKIGIILSVVAMFFIPQGYVDRFESIFTGEEKEGHSTQKRLQILEDAWEVFKTHPLGVGVGAFPLVRGEMFNRHQDTHNLYLELLTNIGIHGFVVFALLIWKLLRTLKAMRLSFAEQIQVLETSLPPPAPDEDSDHITNHRRDLRLLQALAMAVSAFLIARLSLGMFGMDLYEIYWWLAIGLTLSLFRMEPITWEITNRILKNQSSTEERR